MMHLIRPEPVLRRVTQAAQCRLHPMQRVAGHGWSRTDRADGGFMSIMFFTASVVAASQRWRSTSTGTSTAWAA